MTEHPRAFALLTAQIRAYGGKIVPNVVNGHNVTTPAGRTQTFGDTGIGGANRAKLLDFLRRALAAARNPIRPGVAVRFELVEADADVTAPTYGMLGILDTERGELVGWTLPGLADAVIAGIRDAEITREV